MVMEKSTMSEESNLLLTDSQTSSPYLSLTIPCTKQEFFPPFSSTPGGRVGRLQTPHS